MHVEVIPAHEYRRARWRNGLGWTREVAGAQAPDGQLLWRASVAEIDEDGPFSSFPGLDRRQVLLSGEGFDLAFADGSEQSLLPPHGQAAYPGEAAPMCRLRDGPAQAWNLFTLRGRVACTLLHRPLVGSMVFFAEPGVSWVIYLLSGQAEFRDRPELEPLGPGDSAVLSPPRNQEPRRLILGGGGELIAARIAA